MVILDTCIIIELQRGNQQVVDKVYGFEQQDILDQAVNLGGEV